MIQDMSIPLQKPSLGNANLVQTLQPSVLCLSPFWTNAHIPHNPLVYHQEEAVLLQCAA